MTPPPFISNCHSLFLTFWKIIFITDPVTHRLCDRAFLQSISFLKVSDQVLGNYFLIKHVKSFPDHFFHQIVFQNVKRFCCLNWELFLHWELALPPLVPPKKSKNVSKLIVNTFNIQFWNANLRATVRLKKGCKQSAKIDTIYGLPSHIWLTYSYH